MNIPYTVVENNFANNKLMVCQRGEVCTRRTEGQCRRGYGLCRPVDV